MMQEKIDAAPKEIKELQGQGYEWLPTHKMIGKQVRMIEGNDMFFYPGTIKEVQLVKRSFKDGTLYFLVYGDGEYCDELFLVPAEHFVDDVPPSLQKAL